MDTDVLRIYENEAMRFKEIRLRSLREDPDAFGSTLEVANTWDDENWRAQVAKLTTFIATYESVDVGVARAVKDEKDSSVAWVISMWVAPEARGKGIGSHLILEIVEWARSERVECLKLDVVDTNAPAVKLYEKHGFRQNGISGHFPEPRTHVKEHQLELRI